VELQQHLEKIKKQGLGLAAISYDSVPILKTFSDRVKITYPLLSDPGSKVIKDYGIFSDEVPAGTPGPVQDRFKPGGAWYGVPKPGTFIIDPNGVVTSKFFEDAYQERYTASEILVRTFGDEPGAPQATTETKHLKLSNSASLTTVKWGQRMALILDVDLKPKMHVYAPGVQGYIPIDWAIDGSPAIKVQEIAYPKSKMLRLKAIKETVPVYENRVRLVRDITIAPDAQVRPALNEQSGIVIHGSVRYQACDDKKCYLPQSIPLTWTLQYDAMDATRVPEELRRKASVK